MKHYAVYDKSTGEVLRHGSCSDAAFAALKESIDPSTHGVMEPEVPVSGSHVTRDGRFVDTPEHWVFDPASGKPKPDLESMRDMALSRVDQDSEAARNRYLTPGAGQTLEYQAAAAEAGDYQVGVPGTYDLLQASVDAGEAEDLEEAAAIIATRHAQWAEIGAQIRRIRLRAKTRIRAAQSVHEVMQIQKEASKALMEL